MKPRFSFSSPVAHCQEGVTPNLNIQVDDLCLVNQRRAFAMSDSGSVLDRDDWRRHFRGMVWRGRCLEGQASALCLIEGRTPVFRYQSLMILGQDFERR
jgi:hypothetical protein